MESQDATAAGNGVIIPKACYAAGGTIQGTGQVIRANGEVVEFTLQSDPLTESQAEQLNKSEASSWQ